MARALFYGWRFCIAEASATTVGYEYFLRSGAFPTQINDILDRTLMNLSRNMKHGDRLTLKEDKEIAFALDQTQLFFYLETLSDDKLIKIIEENKVDNLRVIKLTAKGWNHVATLERGNQQSNQGFIAMSFDGSEKTSAVREMIKTAIQKAGYNARLIDEKPHHNDIAFEMLAEIKKVGF